MFAGFAKTAPNQDKGIFYWRKGEGIHQIKPPFPGKSLDGVFLVDEQNVGIVLDGIVSIVDVTSGTVLYQWPGDEARRVSTTDYMAVRSGSTVSFVTKTGKLVAGLPTITNVYANFSVSGNLPAVLLPQPQVSIWNRSPTCWLIVDLRHAERLKIDPLIWGSSPVDSYLL